MKGVIVVGLCLIGLAGGCEQKDQDAALAQGKIALNTAEAFAGDAWKSACESANKLTADSGRPALESAANQLQGIESQIKQLKDRSRLDDLKLEDVKRQLQRIQAAMNVQSIRAQIDERVESAKRAKDNAEKSYDDVKAKLDEADREYKGLQQKLGEAQDVLDSATAKVKETSKKVQTAAEKIGL